MVSNKSNKKAKKPIETTLGKAPSKPKEKETDISHLQKPIDTSICGIKQVISLLETATNEVKNFVMFECDIMYECKICRSIFRSLANFILHKRNYCREKINPLDYINNNDSYQESIYTSEETASSSKEANKSLNNVIKKLHDLDHVRELSKNLLNEDLSSEPNNQIIKSMSDLEEKSSSFNKIVLEKIETSSSGMFQTLVDNSHNECSATSSDKNKSTKLEVMEIHKMLENDVPILDPAGKICGFTSNKLYKTSIFPKSEFTCVKCSHRFSSQKSLTHHIKYVHNPSRIVYICPTCKDPFANPWCVYRHLLKVHRMTNKQVRRMREQVHNSWIRRGEESSIQKKKPPEISQADSENQWINDIEEDNDFQMCAGCGKHFERKAALHSHSQMCAKRLEVCNNIKENAKKKEEEEALEKAKLEKTVCEKSLSKGASKRKCQTILSYQRKPENLSEPSKTQIYPLTDENTSVDNTEFIENNKNNDILNVITNMLTPKPSPSKDDKDTSVDYAIQQKEIKHLESPKDFKTIQLLKNNTHDTQNKNSNDVDILKPIETTESATKVIEEMPKISVENNDISLDIIIIKMEQNPKAYNDVSNVNSNNENAIVLTSSKVEETSSKENSCSAFSHPQPVAVEDNSGPQSVSFAKSTNVLSTTGFSKLCLEENSKIGSNISVEKKEDIENLDKQSNTFLESQKMSFNLKTDSRSEKNSQPYLNLCNKSRKSTSVVSDDNDAQEDITDTLLQDTNDLLSNEVTFEMFCKKIAKVEKSSESSQKLEVNRSSPRVLRKRKKLIVPIQKSHKLKLDDPNLHGNEDDDDDVIFVGEAFDKHNKTSNTLLALENGFAGFSNEETTKVSYSIDLSNLSYNNPLKCKQKDGQNDTINDALENKISPQGKPLKRKCRSQSVENKSIVSKHEISEMSFILRASPYMNRDKLLCIPCGLTFKSFNLLLWHMSAHFSWFRYQCSKCSFISFNKYDCMLHARKQHKLKENSVANFILPLPNWKTVLMSHEFRLLKDCNDLKGKHTDEKIGIDESQDQNIEANSEILESDAILFGESSRSSEENTGCVIEKENVRKRSKSGKIVIDVQETIKDLQKLPEPVELAMPADISEVIRTFSFNESTFSSDEAATPFDNFGDESNDDWGLPKDIDCEKPSKTDVNIFKKENDDNDKVKDESVALNIRPSRIRTKAKQSEDFVYYDNDINNVLKSTEIPRSSSQKQRTDCIVANKPKISGKSVPTTQKKKA